MPPRNFSMTRKSWFFLVLLVATLVLVGSQDREPGQEPGQGSEKETQERADRGRGPVLSIVAGSESKAIQDIMEDVAHENGFQVSMTYLGSVEQMLALRQENFGHDAMMPASSIWLRLGDAHHRVRDEATIMQTPIVYGVKPEALERLGWKNRPVSLAADIMPAVKAGTFRFAQTSATQSNSGATNYLATLTALSGKDTALTEADLEEAALTEAIKEYYTGHQRSSGSSGWLAESFPRIYGQVDAMVNYESMLIQVNRELEREGKAPLRAVYPTDGLAMADPTLAFVDTGANANKRELFVKLRDGLLSPERQEAIAERGFRPAGGPGGVLGAGVMLPEDVFRTDWGIDPDILVSPVPLPRGPAIEKALNLYQEAFRRPSYTFFCVDVSGSMQGEGIGELRTALSGVLSPDQAKARLLQATQRDTTVILPFNHTVGFVEGGERYATFMEWFQAVKDTGDLQRIQGADPARLLEAVGWVNTLKADGGTNIYLPVMVAFLMIKDDLEQAKQSLVSIVLLTDGRSRSGELAHVEGLWRSLGLPMEMPPIHGITFGEADESQLAALAELSVGRIFHGGHGLAQAFRHVRGYN